MTVIAFDPGISTGVAIHTSESHRDFALEGIDSQYLTVVTKEVTDLWDIIDKHQPDTIICENFAAGGLISKDGQATLRLIGAIEVICYRHNIKFVLHFPSEIHNSGPWKPRARELIKQIKKTPISHEIDALAHLLLYEDRLKAGTLDKIIAKRRRMGG